MTDQPKPPPTEITWPIGCHLDRATKDEDGVYALDCVAIEPSGEPDKALLVATDGRLAAVVTVDARRTPIESQRLLPRAAAKCMAEPYYVDDDDYEPSRVCVPRLMQVEPECANISTGETSMRVQWASAKFPPWRAVIPPPFVDGDARVQLRLNAALLADLQSALGAHSIVLTFDPTKPTDAIRVDADSDSPKGRYGVIMPITKND